MRLPEKLNESQVAVMLWVVWIGGSRPFRLMCHSASHVFNYQEG